MRSMASRWRPESDVGVDVGGDGDVGVDEELFDHDEVYALIEQETGARVSQVVKADLAESGSP